MRRLKCCCTYIDYFVHYYFVKSIDILDVLRFLELNYRYYDPKQPPKVVKVPMRVLMLFFTSIKRPTPLLNGHYLLPQGWPLNRGSTVLYTPFTFLGSGGGKRPNE